jgi:Macrocin-O-methyltransferase (TylF)
VTKNISEFETWEFGALGIHNPRSSTLMPYFDLIEKLDHLEGDVLELGVAQGNSLITTGMILEQLKSKKKVFGVDTFSGFPDYAQFDYFDYFLTLLQNGEISHSHFEKVNRNKELVEIRGGSIHPSSISNSKDFSETSLEKVQTKISNLKLDHRIEAISLDISKSLGQFIEDKRFSLVLLDVDLYLGYANSLPAVFNSLSKEGVIYLDEYYSLKFPGPRYAVNRFLETELSASLSQLGNWLDFERWIIKKH